MSTIRRRLTQRLLWGWILLLATGAATAYLITRAALTRQFDNTLRAKAVNLTTLTEQDNDRLKLEFADPFMREFENPPGTAYFQIWDTAGTVIKRSPSLRDANLPWRQGTGTSPEFWNLILPTGDAGRAIGLRFKPQISDDANQSVASVEAILVIAFDRGELDRTLAILRLVLAICGTLILVLTAVTVPRLLRHELAPLDRLADLAQRITVESLATRFPIDGLPGELSPISRRLNDLLQRLQTAFERERQFSDDLAHEFRTPIAELRSLTELSIKWPDTRHPDTDQNILAIALQMESIVTRLLAIARSEREHVPIIPARIEVTALVASVLLPLRDKAAARQLRLQWNGPPLLEIESDPVLLRSVITNLADNAVAYAPKGGIIDIQSAAQNGCFTVRVSNPVDSLRPEDLPHLCERFWRKEPARSGTEHSGLGLALARAFSVSLGYTLKAELEDNARLVMTLSGPVKLPAVN
jgi:signal transduction histidine kinase